MGLSFDAVEDVLQREVLPLLASHGGGVKLCGVTPEGDVRIAFRGACASCPSMSDTMNVLVEGSLRRAFPGERLRVLAVNDVDEDLWAQAKAILGGSHQSN